MTSRNSVPLSAPVGSNPSGSPRSITEAEHNEAAWFGAAVYMRGRLLGFAPVRWLTWTEHLATLADMDDLCTFRHFRFSGSRWEVVTQQKGTE
jgi:hypothetical protein